MALHLTPDMLEATYELLRTTPPFRGWKLPPGDEVEFRVSAHAAYYGEYQWRGTCHRITISARYASQLSSMMRTMAHEMIHLHQRIACTENKNQHNARFRRIAAMVSRLHGFDPASF